MNSFFKALAVPTLVTLISGVVVGIILERYKTPEAPTLIANVQWIDVPNSRYFAYNTFSRKENNKQDTNLIDSNIFEFINKIQFYNSIRIAKITIDNISNIRSNPVEISSDKESIFSITDKNNKISISLNKINIPPIDPNGSVHIVSMLATDTTYFPPDLTIIHNDRLVNVKYLDMSILSNELLYFISGNPFLSLILFGIMLLSTVLAALSLVFGITSELSYNFRPKITSSKDLSKLINFIDFMKENYPEKLSAGK